MTSSPSNTEATVHPLQEFADHVAETVGGTASIEADTIKVRIAVDEGADGLTKARDDLDLVFFSWLSAIDWANEVEAGDALNVEVDERFELLCTVGDLTEGRRVTFSTDLSKDKPSISSLVDVYAGANWHEREAAEMFGILFVGHPNLEHLYLLDSFIGNPLRKSYPLLSREVKPWPGSVDVEAMPEQSSGESGSPQTASTENPEA